MTLKKYSVTPVNGEVTPLYTVPFGKKAIVKQLLAIPELIGLLNHSVNVYKDNNVLTSGNSVATTGNNLLLNDFLVLNENETILVQNTAPFVSTISAKNILPSNITGMMLNDAGTTIIVFVSGYGVYRSTDDANTWTKVRTDSDTIAAWAYIAGSFFFYKANGTTIKSTDDGLNWTSHNYSNVPTYTSSASPSGRISKNASGVYAGLLSSQWVVYTVDGMNWTLDPDITGGVLTSVIWAGNKWVVSVNGGSCAAYYKSSFAQSGWTALSSVNSISFSVMSSNSEGINTNSGILLAITTGITLMYSFDGGGTWYTSAETITSGGMFIFTPSLMLGLGNNAGTIKYFNINDTTLKASGSLRMHNVSYLGTYIRNNKIYGVHGGTVWKTFGLDLIRQRNYGITFFISLAEV